MSDPDARSGVPLRRIGLLVALGLPLSGLLLYLALRGAHPGRVKATLRRADAGEVAAAVVLLQVVYVLQGERWRALAGGRLPLRSHVGMVFGGLAVNNVLPGRIGDLLRSRWLAIDARMPGGRALATVAVDRGADLTALAGLMILALPFIAREEWIVRIVIGGVAAVAALAALALIARTYTRLRPRERMTSRSRVRRLVRDTLDGVAGSVTRRQVARALVLSLLAWGTWGAAAFLVAHSLGVELRLVEVVFLTAAMNLGVAIPSSPGFVGAYQWLAVSAFAVFGLDRELGLAFSILMQASWYLPTTIVGGAVVLNRMIWHAGRATGKRPAANAPEKPTA